MIKEIKIKKNDGFVVLKGDDLSELNPKKMSFSDFKEAMKLYPKIESIEYHNTVEDVTYVDYYSWNKLYLAVVSNADNMDEINDIIDEIYDDDACRVETVSSFYNYLKSNGESIVCGCIGLDTLDSIKVLKEKMFSMNTDNTKVYLLLFNDEIIEYPDLIIPYEKLSEKLFMLEPLNEIATYAFEPVSGKRIKVLLDEMKGDNKCDGCSGCSKCSARG